MNFKNFSEKECLGMNEDFMQQLQFARDGAGIPFILTSTVRTPEDNLKWGGVEDSAHLSGLAVDIRCNNSEERFRILRGIFGAGFVRVGVYEKHIHVDGDFSKPQEVVWVQEKLG